MKVYISIPISGRPLEKAKEHAQWLKDALTEHSHECVTPFDICPEQGKPYAHYMGRDIEALISGGLDAVV